MTEKLCCLMHPCYTCDRCGDDLCEACGAKDHGKFKEVEEMAVVYICGRCLNSVAS